MPRPWYPGKEPLFVRLVGDSVPSRASLAQGMETCRPPALSSIITWDIPLEGTSSLSTDGYQMGDDHLSEGTAFELYKLYKGGKRMPFLEGVKVTCKKYRDKEAGWKERSGVASTETNRSDDLGGESDDELGHSKRLAEWGLPTSFGKPGRRREANAATAADHHRARNRRGRSHSEGSGGSAGERRSRGDRAMSDEGGVGETRPEPAAGQPAGAREQQAGPLSLSANGVETGHLAEQRPRSSSGWKQAFSEDHDRPYYYNEAKKITQWELPEEGFEQTDERWVADSGASGMERERAAGTAGEEAGSEGGLWEGVGEAAEGGGAAAGRSGRAQRPCPRMESTGLMPSIPQPCGTHIRFPSSSPSPPSTPRDGDGADLGPGSACLSQLLEGVRSSSRSFTGCAWDDQELGVTLLLLMPEGYRTSEEEAVAEVLKFLRYRHTLFCRFDRMEWDVEGLYSVTPQTLARHQAWRLAGRAPRRGNRRMAEGVALDAFCGLGGNAIALAEQFAHVVAVDINPNRIRMAAHNAAEYGVDARIEFVCTDSLSLQLLPGLPDAVFLSPPWGGPGYKEESSFSLQRKLPGLRMSACELVQHFWKALHAGGRAGNSAQAGPSATRQLAVFLPRTTQLDHVTQLCGALQAGDDAPATVELELNVTARGRMKGVTLYLN